MAERDELDALAGEFVLGTLSADERRVAEARLLSDSFFRAAVAAWELRLQPLADDSAPLTMPPKGTFEEILRRIGDVATLDGNVVEMRRAIRRWRIASAALGAAAAALLGIVVVDRNVPSPQSEFVAVLTAEGAKPVFVATVDVQKGTLSIRRIGDPAPADRSFELWAIEPVGAPKSLGIVEQASLSRTLTLPASGELTLAISLEPKGGSPTGAVTGPVLYTGALVPAE